MPLRHLRICVQCDQIRYAPCSIACRVPHDGDKDSWVVNLQDGAGTIPKEEEAA